MSGRFCAAPLAAAERATPDATIEVSGNTVAAGIAYTEAKGTLHYHGKSYPIEMRGLSAGQVGVSNITATGVPPRSGAGPRRQLHLRIGGAALAGGGTGTAMQNPKGVIISMRATTEGIDLWFSVDGVSMKVAQ